MNFVCIFDKEIILRKDEKPLTEADFENLKALNSVADEFTEKQNDLSVLALASADNLSDQYQNVTLREYNVDHTTEERFLAYRAKALTGWHRETKFCGACGSKLVPDAKLTAMDCPECKRIIFPRISPCIIVLIINTYFSIFIYKSPLIAFLNGSWLPAFHKWICIIKC